ncbi:hypothetical protein EVAR_48145_1 [Eumeta japonica]|uniref:Uncharacterized protein n=1 Tax=Eumeta variegata TaxID=151549 RepID=A0A4C1WQY6_EUMVA|nr:hypothetical protein EVAR_48145_1 [Eumeta japonica]
MDDIDISITSIKVPSLARSRGRFKWNSLRDGQQHVIGYKVAAVSAGVVVTQICKAKCCFCNMQPHGPGLMGLKGSSDFTSSKRRKDVPVSWFSREEDCPPPKE